MDTYFGRETTSSMAHRTDDSLHTVIAALNADFFETNGENYNNQVIGGEVIKGRPPVECTGERLRKNRSQFAITESGRPLIGRFVLDGHLFWNDTNVTRIGGVNTVAGGDSVSVFTHRYNDRIPRGGSRSTFVASHFVSTRDDTLLYTVTETGAMRDSMSVGSDACIVVNYGSSVLGFPPSSGDTLRILFGFPPAGERIIELVGGFPQIVRDKKNVVDEVDALEGPLPGSFGLHRHPRTGVGHTVTGDTLIWITVDGRQDSSAGMTLNEFADLMISHGVFQD
jgi:Phosphodiester glycosidase